MSARGLKRTPCALLSLALLIVSTSLAGAWEQQYRYPIKVKVSGNSISESDMDGPGGICSNTRGGWDNIAGASRRQILCPRKGFDFLIGLRPFFTNVSGLVKAVSKGGEGTPASLRGHLRIPTQNTLWELHADLRMWDKVTFMLSYNPWHWGATGHAGKDGNFAGVLYTLNESIETNLNITSFVLGADYDVSFSDDLIFGPNADFHVIRWDQSLRNSTGDAVDFTQTILQPAIGLHVRYSPTNTGYFSWFKPSLQSRISWMSFAGLGMSTWKFGAGVAPPISENLDVGFVVGYKQWKIDGIRNLLTADVTVEGMYFDFQLRF